MKERIVIEKNNELFVMSSAGITISPTEFEHTIEQVPETFEELKELCRELKNKDITIYDDAIAIDFPSINGGFNFHIYITKNEIDINTSIFAQNRTIPQIWAFIKSLIGEE